MIIGDCLIVKECEAEDDEIWSKEVVLPVFRSSRLMHFFNFFFFAMSIFNAYMPSKSSRNRGFNYSTLHIYTYTYTYKSERGGNLDSNSKMNRPKFETGT